MSTALAKLRRCTILYLEKRERLMFNPVRLLHGEGGLVAQGETIALVPQLEREVMLSAAEVAALDGISPTIWQPVDEVARTMGEDCLQSLLAKGILVEQGTSSDARDEQVRGSNWHPLIAVAHAFSRWTGTDSVAAQREARLHSVDDMVAACGPPPHHFHKREDAKARTALLRPEPDSLDALMGRRATCRNFDTAIALSQADLSAVLNRAFGMQGSETLAPGAVALKKNHPSGGGLHPLEAYLIVQRVDGLQPGLYHYNVESHALDLLRAQPAAELQVLALTAVAGQEYFSEAPVMLVIAARFTRSFWKYRNHPKIYRAILLEAGHASQNLYLAATDLGLGAYITAAINEVDIEHAFNLDPLLEAPLAVCGLGRRAVRKRTVELDPGAHVWDEADCLVASLRSGSCPLTK